MQKKGDRNMYAPRIKSIWSNGGHEEPGFLLNLRFKKDFIVSPVKAPIPSKKA